MNTHIYQLVLAAKLENLGSEERYFLLRFIHKYGFQVVTLRGVVELAGALGMDQIPVGKAVSNLVKAEYLVTGKKALGQHNYLCSEKLRMVLTMLEENRLPVIHEQLIEKLIFGMVDIKDGKERLLKSSHRLLFAVLLFVVA